MSYYESSDYCGCTLGDISFYYGYEVEQDGEWCFTATKNKKEIAKYKSSELTNNKFELAPNLFAGINKMFKDGLIEINIIPPKPQKDLTISELPEYKKIYDDLKNNDHRSLEVFLSNKFDSNQTIDGDYVGKTSVDFLFKFIDCDAYDVLARSIKILKDNVKLKFGDDIKVIPLIMDELLPERLGIELWCYK